MPTDEQLWYRMMDEPAKADPLIEARKKAQEEEEAAAKAEEEELKQKTADILRGPKAAAKSLAKSAAMIAVDPLGINPYGAADIVEIGSEYLGKGYDYLKEKISPEETGVGLGAAISGPAAAQLASKYGSAQFGPIEEALPVFREEGPLRTETFYAPHYEQLTASTSGGLPEVSVDQPARFGVSGAEVETGSSRRPLKLTTRTPEEFSRISHQMLRLADRLSELPPAERGRLRSAIETASNFQSPNPWVQRALDSVGVDAAELYKLSSEIGEATGQRRLPHENFSDAIRTWGKWQHVHPMNILLSGHGFDSIELGDTTIRFPPIDREGRLVGVSDAFGTVTPSQRHRPDDAREASLRVAMDIDKDRGIDRFVQQRRVSAAEASGTPVTELQAREATARSLGMSTDELRLIPTQLQNQRPWEVSFDEFSAHIGPEPHKGTPYQEWKDDPVKWGEYTRWSEKRRSLNAIWERSVAEAVSEGRLPLDDPRALSVSSLSRYGQEMKPLPERLWHVTTAGDAIEEVGPKTRAQLGMTLGGTGLGAGPDDTISFTDDFDTAKNIKRAMIEARKVASGEITIADMLDMARRGEGAKKPFYDSLTRVTSEDVLERLARGYTQSDRMMLGKLVSEVPSNWIPINPQRNSQGKTFAFRFERPMSPSEIRHQRFEIYKQLSFVRESAGGPENPLFMSTDVARFAGTPEDQIRIIEYEPKPGAKGYQVSALGEWRTYSGDAVSSRGEVGIDIGRPRAAAPEAPRTSRPKRGGQGTVGTIGGIAGLGISGVLAAQAARGTVPEEVRESGVEAFYRFKGGKPVEVRELDPKSKAVQAFVENEEALQWALQNNRISEDAYKQLSSLRK